MKQLGMKRKHCLLWRFGRGSFGGSSSQELMNELKQVLLEVEKVNMELKLLETAPQSFSDLIADVSSDPHQDIKGFALKIKAMMLLLEQLLNLHHNIELARLRESVSRHLASIDIPKSMHCLSLILMEEYYRNAMARSPVPPPEYVSHLNNHSFIHLALLTDNVLAAAVVVSSTIKSSANPGNLVFHIVTDKKSYAAMHSWFALNPMFPAVVEVRGLHQFEWPSHVSASIMETVKIHQISWDHSYHRTYSDKYQRLEALHPSSQSLLNYLVIHLPVNHESGFAFWHLGSSLPPALIAFEGHTYSILPSWHLWGLGHRLPEDDELLRSSAVLHFSGPAKPWLQIGFPVLRNLWHAHVNLSNEFVKSCGDPE